MVGCTAGDQVTKGKLDKRTLGTTDSQYREGVQRYRKLCNKHTHVLVRVGDILRYVFGGCRENKSSEPL